MPSPTEPPERVLTGREWEVLTLLADGLTAVAIGRTLRMSPRTVEKHAGSAYRKLQVRNGASAVRVALSMGLIEPVTSRSVDPDRT
jgi:DNA-binding NarL/FixJ family response regulator